MLTLILTAAAMSACAFLGGIAWERFLRRVRLDALHHARRNLARARRMRRLRGEV